MISHAIHSRYLERSVVLSFCLPAGHDHRTDECFDLVIFQDGQDFRALLMEESLQQMTFSTGRSALLIVGVHADHNRVQEYGTALQPDYAGRGRKAGAYSLFILKELLPWLHEHFRINPGRHIIAGCSLGGLMAMDLAWNHQDVFRKAGVFSGALWWRSVGLTDGYHPADRIMHRQIRETQGIPDLQCWFQVGSNDETDDRDNDGVIDSIADTLDIVAELERKGLRWGREVVYYEMENGRHEPATWSVAIPRFLKWASDN